MSSAVITKNRIYDDKDLKPANKARERKSREKVTGSCSSNEKKKRKEKDLKGASERTIRDVPGGRFPSEINSSAQT